MTPSSVHKSPKPSVSFKEDLYKHRNSGLVSPINSEQNVHDLQKKLDDLAKDKRALEERVREMERQRRSS